MQVPSPCAVYFERFDAGVGSAHVSGAGGGGCEVGGGACRLEQAGRAVTVAPQATMSTTQQAADLLGVSRPTVRRVIDVGVLPAEKVGTRHRLLLRDVLEYPHQRRARRDEALAQTAVEIDEDDSAVLAKRRRTRGVDRSAAAGGR
ncbi:helix-turn-helix domain-containing protein [Rhodococcus sp. USK10]|nr:helix-turn-helix domain-containing protein [Rhodococcus sp. USK10]